MTSPTRTPNPPRRPAGDRDAGWRVLLRPVRSSEEGTMPAGLVLVIFVIALVIAMLANASATERKSRANAACDGCWRQSVAGAVAGFAGFFHLTDPRNHLDEALGKNRSSEVSTDELLARQREDEAKRAAAAAAASGTTAPPPTKPVVRAADPAKPLTLWIGGDSITGAFGPSMQRVAASTGLFTPTVDSRVSTGLSRPDYFNWPEHLARDVVPSLDPDVMILMFGANDAQNIPLPNKGGLARFSPEWLAEYRKRVGDTMDLLRSPDNDRLVVWVGALIMGPSSGVEGMDKLNYIYWSEAQKRPWVRYFDAWSFFADGGGHYAAALPFADGTSKTVRAGDNIHLNLAGADRLAWAVLGRLSKELDLSKSTTIPPAAQLAPADVHERPEVPATA